LLPWSGEIARSQADKAKEDGAGGVDVNAEIGFEAAVLRSSPDPFVHPVSEIIVILNGFGWIQSARRQCNRGRKSYQQHLIEFGIEGGH
jgi:hypothetical protein